MKLLIASDIHGSAFSAKRIVNAAEKDTRIIILGDVYNHGPRNPFPERYAPMEVAEILNAERERLIVIQGNCDSEVDQMISKFTFQKTHEMNIDGKRLFFSHGHINNIDTPPKGLKPGTIMFYGHFHIPFIREKDGVYYVNPGSCALPAKDLSRSYAMFDTENSLCSICDFDGNLITERVLG